MDCLNKKRIVQNTCAGMVAALFAASAFTANAQADKNQQQAAEKSALEQYRDMSDNERAAMINDATAKAAIVNRSATPAERAMMTESPAAARAQLNSKSDSLAKRTGSGVGREIRSGNSVGKVLGTAFFNSRTMTLTEDGQHLEACEKSAHTHDAKTNKLLSDAAAAAAMKGASRE